MSDRIINEDVLEKVSGGAGDANEDAKKKEFEVAWAYLKYDDKGLTGTELEDLFAQWQLAGYKPDARMFLQNCKTL